MLASCNIDGASDSSIKNPVPNDFTEVLGRGKIRAVFTTGAKATALYKKYCYPTTGVPCDFRAAEERSLMDKMIAKTFEGVCSDTLRYLMRPENVRCYRKGEHLFRDREATPFVFVILSGKASLYKIGESGQKKVAFILGTGELINEDIHPETTSSVSCEAFENLEVLCIEKTELKEWMKRDFGLTEIILNAANRKIRRLYRQLKNTTGVLKMERRVAAKLWKLANDYGVDTPQGCTTSANILRLT